MASTSAHAFEATILRIPPLRCPFPSEVNPHVEEASQDSFAWLLDTGMLDHPDTLERYRQARFGWLTARAYPLADREMLKLLMDWCIWLFAFDDGFCESERMSRRTGLIARALPEMFRVLHDIDSDDPLTNVFARSLQELKARIAVHAERDQLERWCSATREYIFAQVWEAANREADVVPTPEDYVFMRRRTGAMYPVYALIDIAGGYRLTPEEWHHPDVRALTEHANDLVVWDNDLFSYAKERTHDQARHNLVNVLVTHRGYSVQEALDEVAEMHDHAVAEMVRLRKSVEMWGSPAVDAYVTGLEHWVRGHIVYSLGSARYIHAWPANTLWPEAV
ncbi:terpene synthase family protein [Nonomuraea africana]|uniref:Terpene synthase n=1 Tax=Nonomuraea africana TaxID=46171 RepID=A0ABR9K9C3_9ACTN|nr:hypothetical protein [Nonomuraea africana]MBE1558177.1 hypothetical protein [Nonomuraea africana]